MGKDVRVSPWERAPSDYKRDENYGIGLPNNNPELCRILNGDIKKFIQNEWYDEFNKYLATRGVTEEGFHKPDVADVVGTC